MEHEAVVQVRPRMADGIAAFEDEMVDAPRQLARGREPGGSGADNDRVV